MDHYEAAIVNDLDDELNVAKGSSVAAAIAALDLRLYGVESPTP